MRHKTVILYTLSILAGLVLWELVAAQFSKVVLSPPTAVAKHLYAHIVTLELPRLLWYSLGHTALGYLLAVAVAVPLGFLMGRSEKAFAMFDPIVNALYSIPTIAFVPFLVIWFGLFFPARTALVFIMCVFDILVTVAAGARNVERNLIDVGRRSGRGDGTYSARCSFPRVCPFCSRHFGSGWSGPSSP
jgi:ABC-type nitrate/sulfonate/bicarbonate transport system permease component